MLKYNIISHFVRLLTNDNFNIAHDAIFGLSNIAGENLEFRDLIINEDIYNKLLIFYNKFMNFNRKSITKIEIDILYDLLWLISNLSKGKPHAPLAEVINKMFKVNYYHLDLKNIPYS